MKVRPQPLTLRVPQSSATPTPATPAVANNGQLAAQQVTSTVPQPTVVAQQPQQQPPKMVTQPQQIVVGQQVQPPAAPDQPKLVPQPPGSPILNNLLQKPKPIEQVNMTWRNIKNIRERCFLASTDF